MYDSKPLCNHFSAYTAIRKHGKKIRPSSVWYFPTPTFPDHRFSTCNGSQFRCPFSAYVGSVDLILRKYPAIHVFTLISNPPLIQQRSLFSASADKFKPFLKCIRDVNEEEIPSSLCLFSLVHCTKTFSLTLTLVRENDELSCICYLDPLLFGYIQTKHLSVKLTSWIRKCLVIATETPFVCLCILLILNFAMIIIRKLSCDVIQLVIL